MLRLVHIPKTGGTSLLVNGVPGGHHITYKKGFKFITILRNPVDRTVSHFLDENRGNDSILTDFDIQRLANFQTNWLREKLGVQGMNEIIKILMRDFVVYTTDNLPKKFGHFHKRIRDYTPTKDQVELMKKLNDEDFKLYNMFKRSN